MKHFNSLKEFEMRKKAVHSALKVSEDKIREDWSDIKHLFHPDERPGLFRHIVSDIDAVLSPSRMAKTTFSYGVNLLAEELSEIAIRKFNKLIHESSKCKEHSSS